MNVIFCNIAYMLHYEGQTSRDITPTGAGKWVKENADAHEKWNFLNYDGICYGFVQNKGQFHIERLEGVVSTAMDTDGVMVIWCAPITSGKTVIVGWYENATVYRDYKESIYTPTTGLNRCYFTHAKSENCYLLPEHLRIFEIERASIAGTGKGFGQQNFWYAESEYAQLELIPRILEFTSKHKKDRINRTNSFFEQPDNVGVPLAESEKQQADTYYDNSEYDLYLPLGFRNFEHTKSADEAFYVSKALKELYQFEASINWFNKVIEIEGETWDILVNLPYLYDQVNDYEKAKVAAKKMLGYPQAKKDKIRDEVYSIIADNYMYQGELEEGIKWLNKVLEESTDNELIEHTKQVKKEWIALHELKE